MDPRARAERLRGDPEVERQQRDHQDHRDPADVRADGGLIGPAAAAVGRRRHPPARAVGCWGGPPGRSRGLLSRRRGCSAISMIVAACRRRHATLRRYSIRRPERIRALDARAGGPGAVGQPPVGGHDPHRCGIRVRAQPPHDLVVGRVRAGLGAWATSITVERIGGRGGRSNTTVTSSPLAAAHRSSMSTSLSIAASRSLHQIRTGPVPITFMPSTSQRICRG